MNDDIAKVLLTRRQIAERVHELGELISRDFRELDTSDELVIVPGLTGSIIFVADLMRQIPLKVRISVATVSTHVRNLLNKTGVANRTEATAYAVRRGLAPDEDSHG